MIGATNMWRKMLTKKKKKKHFLFLKTDHFLFLKTDQSCPWEPYTRLISIVSRESIFPQPLPAHVKVKGAKETVNKDEIQDITNSHTLKNINFIIKENTEGSSALQGHSEDDDYT